MAKELSTRFLFKQRGYCELPEELSEGARFTFGLRAAAPQDLTVKGKFRVVSTQSSNGPILTQDIVPLASPHHNQSVFLPSPYRNSDSKQNQIHALTTPVNVVGGAHRVNHTYVPGGVPNHPVEGIVGVIYEQ